MAASCLSAASVLHAHRRSVIEHDLHACAGLPDAVLHGPRARLRHLQTRLHRGKSAKLAFSSHADLHVAPRSEEHKHFSSNIFDLQACRFKLSRRRSGSHALLWHANQLGRARAAAAALQQSGLQDAPGENDDDSDEDAAQDASQAFRSCLQDVLNSMGDDDSSSSSSSDGRSDSDSSSDSDSNDGSDGLCGELHDSSSSAAAAPIFDFFVDLEDDSDSSDGEDEAMCDVDDSDPTGAGAAADAPEHERTSAQRTVLPLRDELAIELHQAARGVSTDAETAEDEQLRHIAGGVVPTLFLGNAFTNDAVNAMGLQKMHGLIEAMYASLLPGGSGGSGGSGSGEGAAGGTRATVDLLLRAPHLCEPVTCDVAVVRCAEAAPTATRQPLRA